MLGKIPGLYSVTRDRTAHMCSTELDRDMVALHSQFQGKWTGKRHAEIKTAFK